jgi:hypothetical protein
MYALNKACEAIDLIDVIPAEVDFDRFHLRWVELYADGVVVCSRSPETIDQAMFERAPETEPMASEVDLFARSPQLSDDVGTEYQPGSGAAGGALVAGRSVLESHHSFSPAPPAEARTLIIRVGDDEVVLPLEGTDERA